MTSTNQKKKIRKAVIPAAGLGTRFLPATKAVPKELLPIVDVPALQLVVEEAIEAGIEDIILVTGRGKAAIEDYFDVAYELEDTLLKRGERDLHARVTEISRRVRPIVVRQKEPLGLGHAVLVAREAAADEPIAVLLPDDLVDCGGLPRNATAQLIDQYGSLGGDAAVIALVEVDAGQEHLYGIVAGEPADRTGRLFKLTELVEKPAPGTAPSRSAIMGRYVLPSSIWDVLAGTPAGRRGEIQLTDALQQLVGDRGCYGLRLEGIRHDVGDRLGYLGANLAYALKRPDLGPGLVALMRDLIARHG